MVLRCPDCGVMLFVEGGLGLVRTDDGGMFVVGKVKPHECVPAEVGTGSEARNG